MVCIADRNMHNYTLPLTSFPRPKLKNIDRSSGRRQAVTVNSVTVFITEYKSLHPDSD